jgi:hypothetical protein
VSTKHTAASPVSSKCGFRVLTELSSDSFRYNSSLIASGSAGIQGWPSSVVGVTFTGAR